MPLQVSLHLEGLVHQFLVFGAQAFVRLREIVVLLLVVDHARLDGFARLVLLFQFLLYEVLLLAQLVQLFPRLAEPLTQLAMLLLLV